MVGRGSPKLNMFLSKAGLKRNSPKYLPPRKNGSSPKTEKARAFWNPALEKSLVELLHEHNTPEYRVQNGWTTEAWNKIVKDFHQKNNYVTFTKTQVQDKKKELKREYRLLKEARKQSGAGWNEQRGMIEVHTDLWNNLVTSYPKLKKFRNKSFPLFDVLGELYDGYTAEGTYNFTSSLPPQHAVVTQVDNQEQFSHTEVIFPAFEETTAYNAQDDEDPILLTSEDEIVSVQRNQEKMNKRPGTLTMKGQEKETKKPKSANVIAGCMDRYIEMREKQFELESAQLASAKESVKAEDYSIKRCIYVVKSMELTKEENNREIFLTCVEDDQETVLIWLRDCIAKLL